MRSLIIFAVTSLFLTPFTIAESEWKWTIEKDAQTLGVVLANKKTSKLVVVFHAIDNPKVIGYGQGPMHIPNIAVFIGSKKDVEGIIVKMGASELLKLLIPIDKTTYWIPKAKYQVKDKAAFLKMIVNIKKEATKILEKAKKVGQLSEKDSKKIIQLSQKDLKKFWGLEEKYQDK